MEMSVEQKRAIALMQMRKRAADAQGGVAAPDPQAAAPQAPRAMGTPPALAATRNTGFGAQVSQGLAKSGMDPRQPVPIPTEQEFGQGFKDFGTGRLQGAAAMIPGFLGDAGNVASEIMPRLGLAPKNVGEGRFLPTTTEAGNYMFGEPKSDLQAFGRNTAVEGPALLKAGSALVKGGARATGAVAQTLGGAATGAGRPAFQEAVRAGREGGSAAETFTNHMRGNVASDEAVKMAKSAVEEMRRAKGAEYRAGIGSTIKGDPAVLDFQPIEDAIGKAANVKMFKGVSLSAQADKARTRINEVIAKWKGLDPAEYHTPEGLDALKQELGDLIHEGELSSIKQHSPASIIVNSAYNAVKDQIVKQAPGYAGVMRDYTRASDQIREVERTLSLGNKATADTGLRKLQSILRNNANTNYGARVQSGEALSEHSPDLMPALAGQALNSWWPRGIQGAVAGSGAALGVPAALTGAASPALVGGLLGSSPRLMGEAAFAMGNARRMGSGLLDAFKNPVTAGGGAGIGGIDPKLLGQISPQVLNQLLLSTRTPVQQP